MIIKIVRANQPIKFQYQILLYIFKFVLWARIIQSESFSNLADAGDLWAPPPNSTVKSRDYFNTNIPLSNNLQTVSIELGILSLDGSTPF